MAWAFPATLADWQNSKKPRGAPPLRLLARESISFAYMRTASTFAAAVPLPITGNGRHVMVLPGFLASDHTTARLRRSLEAAGYVAHGWGLGRNRGIKADIFERIDAQLEKLAIDTPVILVGWSLGGLIAREYAKHAPHRVAKVVTLGSPFSGDLRANNAWRLYEYVAGHSIDTPPVTVTLGDKPPVPTCAIWSAGDGVVAVSSARGLAHESDEQVELGCRHMDFVARPDAIRAIAQALTMQ